MITNTDNQEANYDDRYMYANPHIFKLYFGRKRRRRESSRHFGIVNVKMMMTRPIFDVTGECCVRLKRVGHKCCFPR